MAARLQLKGPLDCCSSFSLPALFISITCFMYMATISCFYIDNRQSPSTEEWSYMQQNDWRHDHRQCGGNAQSPINIQRKYVIPNNHLKLHFYNYNRAIKFKIQNAHHTIKMNPIDVGNDRHEQKNHGDKSRPEDNGNPSLTEILTADEDLEPEFESTKEANKGQPPMWNKGNIKDFRQHLNSNGQISHQDDSNSLANGEINSNGPPPYGGEPTIKLEWLDDGNNEYKLRDIHFHWGERRDNGSEHAIEGKRSAMEMHLVHVKHGLDKSKIGYTSDSVAVISVLIESYRKSNADFNPIVNALSRINVTEQEQVIEYKSIKDLLPNVLTSFYTYSGSLTTPPCYEVVNWVVMSDRLYLNAKQIEMFRNLYAPEKHASDSIESQNLIMPNIRHIQSVNNRTILASFSSSGRLEQIQSSYNGARLSAIIDKSLIVSNVILVSLVIKGLTNSII